MFGPVDETTRVTASITAAAVADASDNVYCVRGIGVRSTEVYPYFENW